MPEPEPEPEEGILRLRGIAKDYGEGVSAVRVLHGIDLSIPRGQLVAIMGPSGSGKSTLLNILGLLDRPTEGELWVEGVATSSLGEDERTRLRGEALGFVFQFHHLLPALTAAENVAMPLAVREGWLSAGAMKKANEALARLSIAALADRRPSEMSGGQRQRVAVARALVAEPSVVFADEPTGNLDTETGDEVFGEMRRLNREHGLTFVVVTHDEQLARRCDRIVVLVDGKLRSDTARKGEPAESEQ